uniref:Peptidase M24 domain-containing protein n=1 Tax=Brassica oleracea var. oleracea TaxID=109376 RepID=A0A0D3BJW8_BRAOL
MATAKSLQRRIFSSFIGNNSIRSTQPLLHLFRIDLGIHHILRNEDEVIDGNRKRLKPGNVSPRRPVPAHITKPPYVESFTVPGISSGLQIHDKKARVREYAGTLVKVVWWWDKVSYFLLMLLYILLQNIVFVSIQQPGVSTDEIDEAVYSMIIENGAYPSPLGYGGDKEVTKESLEKAISICGPGVEYKKIGKTIHDHADKHKYGVVRQFVGHGNNEAGRMVLNQTFTIEPMLTIGSIKPVMWDDNWTVVTEDASLSAQFEHTILITKDGAEILTNC